MWLDILTVLRANTLDLLQVSTTQTVCLFRALHRTPLLGRLCAVALTSTILYSLDSKLRGDSHVPQISAEL
eukprot:875-Heterococcus_DN1.PRE.1